MNPHYKYFDNSIGDIFFDEPLSNHSSWKIGGPADLLIEPYCLEQIIKIVNIIRLNKIPCVIIGKGSNILFSDKGIRGVVIKLGEHFSNYYIEHNLVVAESGVYVPKLAEATAKAGLSGLEHTIGIPGTLGGLICMNGGSQNKSISEIVDKVWTINNNGDNVCYSKEECCFAYRRSKFQMSKEIIHRVELNLAPKESMSIQMDMDKILQTREQKFPLNYPSCGSVFIISGKNERLFNSPGKLIDNAGLKGYQIGGARVSNNHGNFIINADDATAKDIINLVHFIREKIYSHENILLECEIQYVDEKGVTKPLHETDICE